MSDPHEPSSGDAVGARPEARRAVRVWDLPTRLFHWTLALLIVAAVTTAKAGGLWLDWHMRIGYAILALVLFRLLWGFAGSRYARLAHFVRGPRIVLAYLRGQHPDVKVGHNPLGALSVVAMLGVLLVQAATGLFTNDGSFLEGPLGKLVSRATGDTLSTLHRLGEYAVYGLVALHLAAIAYYKFAKREPLVRAMITGDRAGVDAPPAEDGLPMRIRALLLFALAAGLTAYVVTL